MDFEFETQEIKLFKKLNTPAKIQDYLNSIPFNHEESGETYMSPRRMIKAGTAHCFEGALFAAAALMYHDQKPLIMDLQAARGDHDHVVTLFKEHGRWGAISKTNHGVLRYREPVYATVRELALSYFHEYFDKKGLKTLREFSTRPFDLSKYDSLNWRTAEEDVWEIPGYLDDAPHTKILLPGQSRTLRKADPIEIKMGEIVDWEKK